MARPRKTTTQRGLGWDHQQQRDRLLDNHVDGTPCPCRPGYCGAKCPCPPDGPGLPMWRDPARNIDGKPLEADHSTARARGNKGLADRLLLHICNRSRSTGDQPALITTRDWTPGA